MHLDLVRGNSPVFLAWASFGFFMMCVFTLIAYISNICDENPRGWSVGAPFVGVSVAMIRCLVVLLFTVLQLSVFACFISLLSRYKSFSAMVVKFTIANMVDKRKNRHFEEEVQNATTVEKNSHSSLRELHRKGIVGSSLMLFEVSSLFFSTKRFFHGSFCPKD